MIFHLENQYLKIAVDSKGAELKSIFNKVNRQEMLWQANPEFWGKSSPVLFPIVGTLKNGIYIYDENEYKLPRHGFAAYSKLVLNNLVVTDASVGQFVFYYVCTFSKC